MTETLTLHATSVAIKGRGVLLRGPSGSGKSTTALEMMARGALLIADDRTLITAGPEGCSLTRPSTLPRGIEARGVGLIAAPVVLSPVSLALVVDMATSETQRLPPPRTTSVMGHQVPLLHKVEAGYFPAALCAYVIHGIVPSPE